MAIPEERFTNGEISEEEMNRLLKNKRRNLFSRRRIAIGCFLLILVALFFWSRSTQKEPAIPNVQVTATATTNPPNSNKTPVAKKTPVTTPATPKTAVPATTADSSAIASELQKLRGELEELRRQPVLAPTINFPSELTVRLLPQDGNSPIPTQPQTRPESRRRLSDKEAADNFWQDWLQRGP